MHRTLVGLVVLSALASLGADWPRFHGPNGTGTAADTNIPVQFNTKDALWKLDIPGDGHSSPIVWGNKVFLQTATPKDRTLVCISADEGKVLWSKSVPGTKVKIHALSSYGSSTPTTDGEKVYVVFWDGKSFAMHAFDMNGKAVWKRDLGGFKSQHGFGASPVVHNGLVYLNNDQDGKAEFVALSAKDGKIAWQATRQAFRACYSTPFILTDGDRTEVVVSSTAGVTAYDPAKGDVKWNFTRSFSGMALRTVACAAYCNGVIVATSGDGSGERNAVGIKRGDKGDVTASNLLWTNKKTLPYVPCLLPLGDHAYFVNDAGMAGCIEAKTGTLAWLERLSPSKILSSPVLIDGKVYSANEKGDVYVFAAETAFKVLGKSSLGEPVTASPAVANGRLFIRGASNLYCIGSKTSGK